MQLIEANDQRFEFDDNATNAQIGEALDDYFTKNPTSKTVSSMDSVNEAIAENPVGKIASELGSAVGRGATEMVDFFTTKPVNAALELSGSEERVPTLTDTLAPATRGGFMDDGIAKDVIRTSGELIAPGAAAGAVLRSTAKAIPAITGATTTGQGVLKTLGSTTAKQDVAAAALSGAGAEIGEEVGGTPGEAIGAITAPLAPSLAVSGASGLIKTIIRGSDKNIKGINKVIDDFLEVNEFPTVAQATGNEGQQSIENISGRVAGGGRIVAKSRQVADSIRDRVIRIADDISRIEGDESAGLVIKKGITGRGGFVDRFQSKSSVLWKESDSLINDAANIRVDNVKAKLDQLVRGGDIGKILDNPKLAQIKGVLDNVDSIDYRTLRDLRSAIGQKLGNKELITDIPRAELKQVYGAVSEDIKQVARNTSDDALKAFERANRFTRAGHGRIDDFVQRITEKVEMNKIFDAVTRGGEGTKIINTFKRSLTAEEWDIVASNVIRKLGRSTAGQQNAIGDAFSVSKFLTDWNKLGTAKNALFSGTKNLEKYRNSLNKIARVAERVKESGKSAQNPSGTGQFVANASIAGGSAGAVTVGNLPLAVGILSTVAMNNAGARLMTNKNFVTWLGTNALKPASITASQLTALVKIASSSNIDDATAIQSLIEEIEGD